MTHTSGAMPERWQDGHIFGLEPMPSNGPLAAATCSDGAVRFWRLAKGSKTLEPHAICEAHMSGMGSCCSWSSNGHKLASTATDGSVVVLVPPSAVASLSCIPGGRLKCSLGSSAFGRYIFDVDDHSNLSAGKLVGL